jgi:transposase
MFNYSSHWKWHWFLDGGLLITESKKTGDYHEEMNGKVFQEWFKKILPNLEPESVTVMDNTLHHSTRLSHWLNISWH